MSSDLRQSLIRHLPALLLAALIGRYVFLVVTHDPTESHRDPLISESAIAFLVTVAEFVLFVVGGSYSRGRAALYVLLALLFAIFLLWVEQWRYPFG